MFRELGEKLDDLFGQKVEEVDPDVIELELAIEELEVKDWIQHFIWEIVNADSVEDINPDQWQVWGRLSDYQKGLAFYHLLGAFADLIGASDADGE